MARGEHIRVRRPWYWHHGVDVGDGTVIHLPSEPGTSGDSRIIQTSMEEFARDGVVEVVLHDDPFPADEVVARAASKLGRTGYHVLWNNCEHFAAWCVGGAFRSRQVEGLAHKGFVAAMAARAGVGWLARRTGSRWAVRAVPVLRPVATGVAAAGVVVSLLSRSKRRQPPTCPPVDPPGDRSSPENRTAAD